MTPLEAILAKCEFDDEAVALSATYYSAKIEEFSDVRCLAIFHFALDIALFEHKRLMPIMKALAQVIEVQRKALVWYEEFDARPERAENALTKAEEILKGL